MMDSWSEEVDSWSQGYGLVVTGDRFMVTPRT
jgi:hypothetical protein